MVSAVEDEDDGAGEVSGKRDGRQKGFQEHRNETERQPAQHAAIAQLRHDVSIA